MGDHGGAAPDPPYQRDTTPIATATVANRSQTITRLRTTGLITNA